MYASNEPKGYAFHRLDEEELTEEQFAELLAECYGVYDETREDDDEIGTFNK